MMIAPHTIAKAGCDPVADFKPVAVLGMGAMGHGMAASALRAGIPVIVWNRTMEAARDLAERGAQVAPTAADAARRAARAATAARSRRRPAGGGR